MHNNLYHQKPEVHLTINKVLVIAITIFSTLVIPIQIYTYGKFNSSSTNQVSVPNSQSVQTGNVAGASTISNNASDVNVASATTQSSYLNIDFSDESSQYLIIGAGLLFVSLIILIYLIIDSRRYKHYINSSFEQDPFFMD